jgi:uncharacterized protein (DUF934 family)
MPLDRAVLRGGKIVTDDPWVRLADDQPAPIGADIVVSTARLGAEGAALRARNSGRLGVVIAPADKVEEIADQLAGVSLIAVEFPAFRDGRGFTTARLLRGRFRYDGPLRAVGDVLEDLVFFMLRCGFDEFELKAREPEAAFARAAGAFTEVYQRAADSRAPAFSLRARADRGGAP